MFTTLLLFAIPSLGFRAPEQVLFIAVALWASGITRRSRAAGS